MSIRTIKLPYSCKNPSDILKFIKNYNNVLRFTYNRVCETDGISTKDLTRESPIPLPSHFLVRVSSTCINLSNIIDWFSLDIPIPVSLIEIIH